MIDWGMGMDGIINVLKPSGMTSHDVINFFRKTLCIKKAGHTGTLDPGAVGVLPVCIGRGTKLTDYIKEGRKTYRVGIAFGISTDTLDSYGIVTGRSEVNINETKFKHVVEGFKGRILQIPPMYSAIKKDGKKLYELARKGEYVERSPREVRIFKLDIIKMYMPYGAIMDVECSKGTYIRSLCDDIGRQLGCGAYMSFLIRTQTGLFCIDDAYTLERLELLKDSHKLYEAVLPMDFTLMDYEEILLNEDDIKKFLNGVPIVITGNNEGIRRIYADDGRFIGLGKLMCSEGISYLKIYKLLS